MADNSMSEGLDALDKAILNILQQNGRISHVELAAKVELSPSAVHSRIKRLEQRGYIQQYVALVNREQAGYDMLCFIHVNLQLHQPETVKNFRDKIQHMPEVLSCYHLTGEYDYLLKVVVKNRKDLERFVVDRLTPVGGIAKIHTSLVLTEIKSTTAIVID